MNPFRRLFSSSDPMPSFPNDQIRLVVGLGNPGAEYEGTRHNVGFDLLDRIAESEGLEWSKERKFKAWVARRGTELILAKPLTFMNLSGTAVNKLAGFHKIPGTGMLVAYDDVSLPVGALRFRANGSAGGHNGIKSIIQSLGHDKFPRLKIGIGGARPGGMVGHVLGRFSPEEKGEMEKVLANASDAVSCALASGLDAAMNRYNQKAKTRKKNATQTQDPKAPAPSHDHETQV